MDEKRLTEYMKSETKKIRRIVLDWRKEMLETFAPYSLLKEREVGMRSLMHRNDEEIQKLNERIDSLQTESKSLFALMMKKSNISKIKRQTEHNFLKALWGDDYAGMIANKIRDYLTDHQKKQTKHLERNIGIFYDYYFNNMTYKDLSVKYTITSNRASQIVHHHLRICRVTIGIKLLE